MNERDELLLKLAKMMDSTEWWQVMNLADCAFSVKTREEIRAIGKSLYHKEEGEAGSI